MTPAELKAVRNLEIVPLTRGQLVELMVRLCRAEGMNPEQARIHADVRVDLYIRSLKEDNR